MSPDDPSAASSDLADAPEALAALARRERFAQALTDSLSSRSFKRLVLSKPRPGSSAVAEQLQRITAKPALIKGQACLSLLFNHATRDITKNPPEAEAASQLLGWLGSSFSHGHLFTADEELQLLYSKRGKVSLHRSRVVVAEDDGEEAGEGGGASPDGLAAAFGQGHQRQKRHALTLDLPFLQALGVTDARKQLVPAMARKWKQINKFVEVLDHALDEARLQPGSEPLHVVDFGAGKGYLTFATHHHLTQQRHWPARVMGVELRPDLVTLCNAAVQRLGLEGLEFACGDVRSVVPPRVDVMIALHACDNRHRSRPAHGHPPGCGGDSQLTVLPQADPTADEPAATAQGPCCSTAFTWGNRPKCSPTACAPCCWMRTATRRRCSSSWPWSTPARTR